MKSKPIHSLLTTFSLPLAPADIPAFRGAVAEAAGWEQDLFHNHAQTQVVPVDEGQEEASEGPEAVKTAKQRSQLKASYHYRYPLIQYRVIDGKAAIFALGEGAQALRRWLLTKGSSLKMGGRDYPLLIEGMKEAVHDIRMLPEPRGYRLLDYQPFHQENYRKWREAENLHQRIDLLQQVLQRQITAMAASLERPLPEPPEVHLMLIKKVRTIKLHGNSLLAFNLLYKAHVDLPPGLALGRGVSHGFGVQMPTRSSL
jgi:hypothetical protein